MDEELSGNRANQIPISIDVPRALEVLSGNVFAGQQACIRELIANAADSILQLSPDKLGNVEIRVIPDRANGILTVSDNGIGMTKEEAASLLGTIFSTAKAGQKNLIGQFGIGFYSCFPLCSVVEVLTRTRRPDDIGTRVLYKGGQTLQVDSAAVRSPGTTVRLHLLDTHKSLLDDETLRRFVRKDCNFVRYPIYLGSEWTVLNSLDAPWYHARASERNLLDGLKKFYGVQDALAVVPVHERLSDGTVEGVLYIMPSREKPTLQIYSRRILINESDRSLLDDSLQVFLSGVIDAEDLPLVLTRNAILENTPQTDNLRRLLVERLADGLADLARSRSTEFRRLMAAHGPTIKAACLKHQLLLANLRDHFPYRSSLRPSVTLPDYMASRSDHTAIYSDDVSVGQSLIPLYNQANIEVLFMTDSVDSLLRDRWYCGGKQIEFKRLDVDPPVDKRAAASPRSEEIDRSTLEALRMLFQATVNERLQVETRSLGPNSPPALLALSEEDRCHLQLVEAVRLHEKEGRLAELPVELQRMAKTGFLDLLSALSTQTIILNQTNALVQALSKRLREQRLSTSGRGVEALLAKFLYGQALMSSGLYLSTEKLTEISQSLTDLITTLLMP
jgi:molecular chaperone HtpG